MLHELKTWPQFYEAVKAGTKTFEIRKDDRGFAVGDYLLLQEWSPEAKDYTGRECFRKISYIARPNTVNSFDFGIQPGFCVLALTDLKEVDNNWAARFKELCTREKPHTGPCNGLLTDGCHKK